MSKKGYFDSEWMQPDIGIWSRSSYHSCAVETESLDKKNQKKESKQIVLNILSSKELVLSLIKNDPSVYLEASEDLKYDWEVIMATIEAGGSMKLFSHDLRNNKEIVLKLFSKNNASLSSVGKDLRNDEDVAFAAVNRNMKNLSDVSEELKKDKGFLYKIKNLLERHKVEYASEYEELKKYEREENLSDLLNSEYKSKKSKVKGKI